jgi:transcriptional regulator with XRE-family HTH domain
MPSLSEILKDKIGKGSKSKAYIASKLGISEKTVENYINGKRAPKPDRLVRLAELLEFKLSELSEQNVLKENMEAPEPPKEGKDLSLQAIHNLTESGKKLASAHEIMASAQQTMATNEARLISLLENKSIVGDQKDTGVASAQVMRGILVGMAKIASGTRWHSEQEAIRELGRLIDEPILGSKKDESIQTDGGKHSTG